MRDDVKETIDSLREHAQEMLDKDWSHQGRANGAEIDKLARDVAHGFKLIAKALEETEHGR